VGGQHHGPAALPPGKTRYPLYRKLGGPQDRSVCVRKISPPPGFDPRTVQPVASRYTEFSLIFKKTPCPILRNFAIYEFFSDINFNTVLSSIDRSPIHRFIKTFPNPYLYIFVFPSLCSIVSVPYYLWLNIPALVKFLVTFLLVYLLLQTPCKFHTQKCFPLALDPQIPIKFSTSFWETDQVPHLHNKQCVRSRVEICSFFKFCV
jgi:hypothetical protein